MKKYSIIVSFIMLLAVAAPASAINYVIGGAYGNDGYTSPYAGAIVETFNGGVSNLGWEITGNFAIRDGSEESAAAPWWDNNGVEDVPGIPGARDKSHYLTVPLTLTGTQSAVIAFKGQSYNYFGLWWGSMDSYNKLEFLDSDLETVLDFVLGSTFSPGNGAQDDPNTNKYVNFYGMPDFYGVRLTSTSFAFEADNLAVGKNVVPEPTTMLLFSVGLVGLVGAKRKLKK